MLPDFREEKRLWKSGFRYLVGIDEVGRGSLAGPVVACAVLVRRPRVFLDDPVLKTLAITDSKKLAPSKREYIYNVVRKHPMLEIRVAFVSHTIVDRINVRNATILAMTQAVRCLRGRPSLLLIDGIERLPVRLRQRTYVRGDARVPLIGLASICAKVVRDRRMKRLGRVFPAYKFEIHKGYGTEVHRKAIIRFGPSRVHRRSFLRRIV